MVDASGVLFRNSPRKEVTGEKTGVLAGNSDVGQASEFPSSAPFFRFLFFFSFSIIRFGLLAVFFGSSLFLFEPQSRAQVGSIPFVLKPSPKPTFVPSPSPVLRDMGILIPQAELGSVPDLWFSLVIPKIGATGKIFANVDMANNTEYMAALSGGIAHGSGTGLPGYPHSNIFLFAHSTDNRANIAKYNAIFFDLRLLEPGDEVRLYYEGRKHIYRVYEVKIVEPEDTSYLTPTNEGGFERLILQTCWPPGTRAKRILVFAKK